MWGWPPLGGQYHETLAVTEAQAARGEGLPYVTYYRSLRDWDERKSVEGITCPRLIFVGARDRFVAEDREIRIGSLVAEHRPELERLGWVVKLVEGRT